MIVVALSIGAGVMLMWKVKYDKQESKKKLCLIVGHRLINLFLSVKKKSSTISR